MARDLRTQNLTIRFSPSEYADLQAAAASAGARSLASYVRRSLFRCESPTAHSLEARTIDPSPPGEGRRTENVTVRFSPSELSSARESAELASLRLGAYIRARTLGHPVRARVSALDEAALRELLHQGNNLNQLTHGYHLAGHREAQVELVERHREVLEDLGALYAHLVELLEESIR